MSFLTAMSGLLSRHEQALHEVAGYEANSRMVKATLQLGRLRTAKEQFDLLTSYYQETIDALKDLDESGAYQFPLMIQLLRMLE